MKRYLSQITLNKCDNCTSLLHGGDSCEFCVPVINGASSEFNSLIDAKQWLRDSAMIDNFEYGVVFDRERPCSFCEYGEVVYSI